MRYIALLMIAFVLAGCDPRSLPPSTLAPICKALIGPIKYSSTNKMSQRYAAYLLTLDLKKRNQIGVELGCPQYK